MLFVVGLVWFGLVNLTQAKELSEGTSTEKIPPSVASRQLNSVLTGLGAMPLWACGFELSMESDWESHGEPSSKQCSSLASASVPDSRLLPGVPALTSLDDEI